MEPSVQCLRSPAEYKHIPTVEEHSAEDSLGRGRAHSTNKGCSKWTWCQQVLVLKMCLKTNLKYPKKDRTFHCPHLDALWGPQEHSMVAFQKSTELSNQCVPSFHPGYAMLELSLWSTSHQSYLVCVLWVTSWLDECAFCKRSLGLSVAASVWNELTNTLRATTLSPFPRLTASNWSGWVSHDKPYRGRKSANLKSHLRFWFSIN